MSGQPGPQATPFLNSKVKSQNSKNLYGADKFKS